VKCNCKSTHSDRPTLGRGISVVEILMKRDELVHATYCIIAKTLRIDGKGKHSGFRM